jgi:pimeloyl-ACP methyl ester carboxylesterase
VAAWNSTLPKLAAEQRACAYERAGTRPSEPGPASRTAQRIADELAALLDAAGITNPVIVLSHSIGGTDAQAFAQRHADRVAGLVFLDPRTAEYEVGYRDLLTDEERQADERDLQLSTRSGAQTNRRCSTRSPRSRRRSVSPG